MTTRNQNLRLVRPDETDSTSFFDEYDTAPNTMRNGNQLQDSLLRRNDSEQRSRSKSSATERANSEARAASIVVFGGIMLYSFVV